jgi:hypothetical protein
VNYGCGRFLPRIHTDETIQSAPLCVLGVSALRFFEDEDENEDDEAGYGKSVEPIK